MARRLGSGREETWNRGLAFFYGNESFNGTKKLQSNQFFYVPFGNGSLDFNFLGEAGLIRLDLPLDPHTVNNVSQRGQPQARFDIGGGGFHALEISIYGNPFSFWGRLKWNPTLALKSSVATCSRQAVGFRFCHAASYQRSGCWITSLTRPTFKMQAGRQK